MLPSESQFLSLLSIPSTLQLHSTTARFPLSFVNLVLSYDCQLKRFYESFQKTGESLWKTVFVHKNQHVVQLQWMLYGVGWGWMNILGVFNMLWHNFEINQYTLVYIAIHHSIQCHQHYWSIWCSFIVTFVLTTAIFKMAFAKPGKCKKLFIWNPCPIEHISTHHNYFSWWNSY